MQGFAITAQAALLFFSLIFAAGVVLLVAMGSWHSGLDSILKRSLLTLIAFGAGFYYWRFADIRSGIGVSDCDKSFFPDRRYVAQMCYAFKANVLRLWSSDESSLLAERTFSNIGDAVRLYWQPHKVAYEGDDRYRLEVAELPPTLLDRLLAHLP